MDAAEYTDAVQWCLRRSWWLRRLRPDAPWLVRQAVALVEMEPAIAQTDLRPLKDALRARLYRRPSAGRVRQCLLNHLAVPLVADLIFQWWLSRKAEGSTWTP